MQIPEDNSSEELLEIQENETNPDKVLELYRHIQILKEIISSKILPELKTCKQSCQDVNSTLGTLNGCKKS